MFIFENDKNKESNKTFESYQKNFIKSVSKQNQKTFSESHEFIYLKNMNLILIFG